MLVAEWPHLGRWHLLDICFIPRHQMSNLQCHFLSHCCPLTKNIVVLGLHSPRGSCDKGVKVGMYDRTNAGNANVGSIKVTAYDKARVLASL